jgi:hypothetical protein
MNAYSTFLTSKHSLPGTYVNVLIVERFCQDEDNLMIDPYSLRDEMTNDGGSLIPEQILDVYVLACLGIAIKVFSPASGCPVRGKMYEQDALTSESKSGFEVATNASTRTRSAIFDGHKNNSLVEIGGGHVSGIDIANVERVILSELSYRLVPPTSFAFITNTIQLVSFEDISYVRDSLIETSKFQAQLGSLDPEVLRYPPSIIAAAALSNAVHRHLLAFLPNKTRNQSHSFPTQQQSIGKMRDLMNRMEKALQISLESDQRLVSLRRRLNYLSYGPNEIVPNPQSTRVYEYRQENLPEDSSTENKTDNETISRSTENKTEHETISRSPIRRTSKKERPPKKHKIDATYDTSWDASDCFFSLALDSLLSPTRVDPASEKKKFIKKKTRNRGVTDLIHHYNRFIKPELYTEGGNSKASTSAGVHVVHNAVPVTNEIEESLRDLRGDRSSF